MKWLGLTLLLCAFHPAQAWVYFAGDVAADYGVAGVDGDGYEYLSAWVSVDAIYSDDPGPYSSTSVGLLLRLSDSEDPLDYGFDVGYRYLGVLHAGDEIRDLHLELPANEVPAGEYWMHLLLVDDRRWQASFDTRSLDPSLMWRGGIALAGPLGVSELADHSLRISVPAIHNNRLSGHSLDLEAQLYSTHTAGPAGEPTPVCRFELPGLFGGETAFDQTLYCRPDRAVHPDDTLHLALRELGKAHGDVISETTTAQTGHYWAGATDHILGCLLLLLGVFGAAPSARKPQAASLRIQKPWPCSRHQSSHLLSMALR